MHVNKCIFILTFIFAFLSSNWPFSWYILSKQSKEVFKKFSEKPALTAFPEHLHCDLLGFWNTMWVTGRHSIQGTALPAQTMSNLYVESCLEIFLDIHKIRRRE